MGEVGGWGPEPLPLNRMGADPPLSYSPDVLRHSRDLWDSDSGLHTKY